MNQRKKPIILRLLPWLIFVAAVAALVIFVGIPLYAPTVEEALDPPVIEYYEGGKKALVLENEALKMELDPLTTQFSITEKDSGRVWHSNPAKADKDPIANSTNKELLQSTLVVTYSTSQGVIDLNNYKYSIANSVYTIDQTDDAIQVNYTIGKVEKIYKIPTAITEERYTMFTDKMNSKNKKKVQGNYSKYGPSNIDKKDNKDEIIALYPEVINQTLYILNADTSATNKGNIEGYFAEVGYSDEDFEIDEALVAGKTSNDGAVYNVSIIYRLEGNDFVVEIPYDKIRYRSNYPITYLTVLPMFGATGTDEEGFMLVPEGNGALIRYNNGKLSQNSYYANLYGWDYATERKEVVNETCDTYAMFGMTHDGGSFICMIEGATSYGGIQADISGRTNSYNTMSVKYNVLHADRYNVSAKTPEIVFMFEKEMPDDTIVQRYRFLNSDSYVDMAKAYGEYIVDKNPALASSKASEEMPVSVELVGAIDKKVVKFGLPIDSVVATTTFAQAEGIMNELIDANVKNLNIRMSGWCNGGVLQQVLTSVDVESVLGGEKGMKNLIAAARAKNVPLYFDGVNCFAYDSDVFDGFTAFTDAARFTTREQIKIYPYSKITYRPNNELKPFYLVRPEYAKENASNLIEKLDEMDAYGVAFRDIGSYLSANYNPRSTTTREQVKQMNLDTMQEARDAGEKVMIKKGFDYALPTADIVTDMDLNGTSYAIIDATVPVYSIAIHGYKDYTGETINLAGDYVEELLTCAEYGAGLNFTFMAENSQILQNSAHNEFHGAYYEVWKADVVTMINDYQTAMAGLNQQAIVNHAVLAEQITLTEYANGAKVYVNHSTSDYTEGDVSVPARSYVVKGVN